MKGLVGGLGPGPPGLPLNPALKQYNFDQMIPNAETARHVSSWTRIRRVPNAISGISASQDTTPAMCRFTLFVALRGHNPSTLQTDRQMDGRHARSYIMSR